MGRKKKKRSHDQVAGGEDDSSRKDEEALSGSKSTWRVPEGENPSTVYNRVLQFGWKDGEGSGSDVSPPSNWLKEIYTLSRNIKDAITSSDSNKDCSQNHQSIKNDANKKSSIERSNEPKKLCQSSDIKNEINHLSNELNSIKHSLWPAAIHTSQIKNKRNKKTRKRNHNQKGQQQEHKGNPFTTPSLEFRYAREQTNPFENLGTQNWITTTGNTKSFVCRSAMKLANIDAILDFILTSPPKECESNDKKESSNCSAEFKWVDLCGAPGGFSEYILRRTNKCNCKGYGMSLLGGNDDGNGLQWNIKVLSNLSQLNGSQNTYCKQWKVCNGQDGTGDIYNWDNVIELSKMIQTDDNRKPSQQNAEKSGAKDDEQWKVQLVVADGGFDAQRDAENQENLAHALVTSQTAASLFLLKKGGNFVIKMFGFQRSFSLIRHLYHSFDKLILLKPITSRPASAERYVVCLNYHGLDVKFDVLTWRNKIINDEVETLKICDDQCEIEYILDQMDRDMLHLNIQACSEIVSFLQKEEQPHQKDGRGQRDAFDFSYYKKHFKIEF